jgi:nicotinate-nucleotide pyrophosphorylase (carboxylating)
MRFEHLLPPTYKTVLTNWIHDDTPSFDYGGFVVGNKIQTASLYMKQSGIFCGKPFVQWIFDYLDCKIEWFIEEGDENGEKKRIATVSGPVNSILLGERLSLNIVSRASGIATYANKLSELKKRHAWNGVVAATRKTTPGFSLIEKYAVLVGGCDSHRMNVSAMVMLKDNHIWSAGGISDAVKKVRTASGFSLKIEVECSNIRDALDAAESGADVIMLDNMTNDDKREECAGKIKSLHPSVIIEVSGGIVLETLKNYMTKSVDVISIGKLTHGYDVVDFSLKIDHVQTIVGGVPEHFNYPLFSGGDAFTFHPMSGGTGEMLKCVEDDKLDLAIILTEGAVCNSNQLDIVSVFVKSPIHWGIVRKNDDVKSRVFAVSRINSGSHTMAKMMFDSSDEFVFHEKGNILNMVQSVRDGESDSLLWEKAMVSKHLGLDLGIHGYVSGKWPALVIVKKKGKVICNLESCIRELFDKMEWFMRTQPSSEMSAYFGISEDVIDRWFSDVIYATPFEKLDDDVLGNILDVERPNSSQ